MCTTYADDHDYATFIESKTEEDLFFKSISRALKNGINVQTYKKRVNILKNIYGTNLNVLINNFTNINCASTGINIIMKLFQNWPTYEEMTSCLNCNIMNTRCCVILMAYLPTDTLDFLENFVSILLETQQLLCENCDTMTKTRKITIKNHLVIEPVKLFIKLKQNDNFHITQCLESIPKHLITKIFKRYTLQGITAFIPPLSKSLLTVGHYVSYCWRDLYKS